MLVGHVAKVLLQKLLKDMYPRYDSHIFAEIPMGSEHKRNNSSTSYLGFLLKLKWGNIYKEIRNFFFHYFAVALTE